MRESAAERPGNNKNKMAEAERARSGGGSGEAKKESAENDREKKKRDTPSPIHADDTGKMAGWGAWSNRIGQIEAMRMGNSTRNNAPMELAY